MTCQTINLATSCRNDKLSGKIYHLPVCPGYAGMNPASLITFPTEAEAQQAGYRKAKNCP